MWLFFHKRKKMASPKRYLLTRIRVDICCYILQMTTRGCSYRKSDRRRLFRLIISKNLRRTNDNYARRFRVMISLIRTNPWNIRFFQKPVGNTASNSFSETSVEIVSFCSDFNARDILNSERHLSASSRAESKLINSQSEFAFFLFLDLSLARRKC